MNDCCIVTCAFREPYVTHYKRQREVVDKYEKFSWRWFIDRLPYSEGTVFDNVVERFQKSLYGFKPHAVGSAFSMGYEKVIWFDPSVLPTVSPRILFDALDKHPMLVVKGDNPLSKMTNQKALDYFRVTKEELEGVNHIGGTIYGFNFNNPKTVEVFNLWKKAEEDGIFGTQDDFMKGDHWCDESCLALSMYVCGVPQVNESKFTYLNQKDLPL